MVDVSRVLGAGCGWAVLNVSGVLEVGGRGQCRVLQGYRWRYRRGASSE